MKKLLFIFAAVAALALGSCNTENANNETTGADSTAAFNVEQFQQSLVGATDSAAVVDLLNQANDEVKKLVEAGDQEGAKSLLEKIKEIVNTNKDKLAAVVPSIGTLVDQVVAVPEGLKDVVNADSLKGQVKDVAEGAVNDAKGAVADKANEVVDKAAEKVNEGVDKAKEAGTEAAKKGADAAKKGVDDAKKKLGL